MNTSYAYRDLTDLTKILTIFLWLGVVIAAIGVVSSWEQLELLGRRSFSASEFAVNWGQQQVIGLLRLALFVVNSIVFARWIYRANQNVRALGATGLRATPGWAVGSFFVPVFNLWKPYQAMKELWQASQNPAAWQGVTRTALLPLWWTIWLLGNVLEQASFKATMSAMSAPQLETLKGAIAQQMLSDIVFIPLCIVAVTLVSRICRAQEVARSTSQGTAT